MTSGESQHQGEIKFVFKPGQVCHTGFHVDDFEAARRFIEKGLGWSTVEYPVSESPYAAMIDAAGLIVGGVGITGPGFQEPLILFYVATRDLEATMGSIKEHGGTIVGQPIQVPQAGRFVLFQAPGGVFAAAWQDTIDVPAGVPEYEHQRLVGTIVGRPTAVSDLGAARTFFETVFGWTFEERSSPTGATVLMFNDHGGDGGVFFPADEDNRAGTVQVHVLVSDMDAALGAATGAGGEPVGDRIPFGDFGVRQDVRIPSGPIVTLWQDL